MRDTIRGIVGKLRKGIDGYLLVAVDMTDYTIHSYMVADYGELPEGIIPYHQVIGWFRKPIKMVILRWHIENKIGGISI